MNNVILMVSDAKLLEAKHSLKLNCMENLAVTYLDQGVEGSTLHEAR